MGEPNDDGFLAALFLLFFDEEAEKKPVDPPLRGATAGQPLDFPHLRFDGEAPPTRLPAHPPTPPRDP